MDNVTINITEEVDEVTVNVFDSTAALRGGTTGQVLTKASNSDLDFTWAAGGGGSVDSVTSADTDRITIGGTATDPTVNIAAAYDAAITAEIAAAYTPINGMIFSGQWKINGFYGTRTQSGAWNGSIYYMPYFITKDHVITDIGGEVSIGAAGNIRLAIYEDTGSGAPGALIYDSGNIDASVGGFKSYTLPAPVSLLASDKLVWIGYQSSSTSIALRYTAAVFNFIGQNTTGTGSDTRTQVRAFGAFPATATPGAYSAFALINWVKIQ